MSPDPEIQKRLIRFFYAEKERKTLLEGRVYIQGQQITNSSHRITHIKDPLYFDPALETATVADEKALGILLEFLHTHHPIDRRGLVFFPSGKFKLESGGPELSLLMEEDKSWGQAEKIDVFNRNRVDSHELEEMVRLMSEGKPKPSSFIFGRLRERRDYGQYTLLRRYFLE